uniref:Uncharacterized protein n=1 Tax=Leptobrachium leishanense TaxID=445787 RepID=A0A8C5PS41_9ANUR
MQFPNMMASVDLRTELTCSICLNIYTDPVTLPCGHSFCRTCIGNVMDTQRAKRSSCPECREKFSKKPALKRNLRLRNIAESFQSAKKRTGIPSEHNRKCTVHKKVLEYYCCEDAACICVSCRLDGEHRGHQVETLNEASEKKKEKLRNILQKQTSQREEAEKGIQTLKYVKRQSGLSARAARRGPGLSDKLSLCPV